MEATRIPSGYVEEHDSRWAAVDAYQDQHLNTPLRNPYHAAITRAYTNSLARGLQDISVSASQGKFLCLQCKILRARRVLEVGTLGAYSAIWMASAGPEVKVTSLEVDPAVAEIARENIKYAGLEGRIEVVVGKALELLPELRREVEAGGREEFDFAFIDADKQQTWEYAEMCIGMVRKGGVVVVDNVVRHGDVIDEDLAKRDLNVRGTRRVLEEMGKDERVDAVVMQVVSEKDYDGFLLAVVK